MWDVLLQNLPTVILLLVAVIICGADLIKAINIWRAEQKKKVDKIIENKQQEVNIRDEFELLHQRFDTVDQRLDALESRIAASEKNINRLTASDMHDIKSWIVEQYQKFYVQQGWIDLFSAETIDRRYEDYQKEGGNSYIATLIKRLHSLPTEPDQGLLREKGGENNEHYFTFTEQENHTDSD